MHFPSVIVVWLAIVLASAVGFNAKVIRADETPSAEGRAAAIKTIRAAGGNISPEEGAANLQRVAMNEHVVQALAAFPELEQLILSESGITDEQLARLPLRNVKHLYLNRTPISNRGLECLRPLKDLQYLSLARTAVTSEGLAHLAALNSLEVLDLSGTAVTDTGLACLETLGSLNRLNLSGTRISGSRLEPLERLAHLNSVNFGGTQVTALDLLRAVPRMNANVRKTMAALDEKTEFDFVQQPLCDVIEYVRQRHDIEIQFDNRSLNAVGVDVLDTDITSNQKAVTLYKALEAILNPLGLTFAVRHEVLLIAAKPLREAAVDLPMQPAGQRLTPKLAAALMQPCKLEFVDEPLARVVEHLAQKHGLTIVLDPESLANARIDTDAPITKSVKNITLKSCLELLLPDLGLTCHAEEDGLVIRANAGKPEGRTKD